MSNALTTKPASRAEVLQVRMLQAMRDLLDGRITVTEANRITKEVGDELDQIELGLRVVKARSQSSGTVSRT